MNIPHVFFTFVGIVPEQPERYWLPLQESESWYEMTGGEIFKTSLVNETGYVNCSRLLERYNNDPRVKEG